MNRIVLNAVAARIRSVSTANISPSTVTMVGATTTQMTLLVMARRVSGALNIVAQLAKPTNLVPAASCRLSQNVLTNGHTTSTSSMTRAGVTNRVAMMRR